MRSKPKAKARKPKKSSGGGGLGNVDKNLARNEANRNKDRAQWMRIGDGNSVVCRVLTVGKEFKDGYIHQVEFEGKKGSFNRDVMCMDQEEDGTPCEGCRDDLDRRYKFWAVVLQYEAPVFDQKGKVLKVEPMAIRILSGGSRLVKELNKKQKKHSLDTCPIMISQDGTGFDVEYEVEWAPEGVEALTAGEEDSPFASDEWEKTPMDDDEEDVIEKQQEKALEKVKQQTTIPEEGEFYELPGRDDDDDDDDDRGEQSRRRGSGFARRKKKGSARRKPVEDDDDEDDDDEEERPARRAKSKSKLATSKAKSSGLKTKTSGSAGMKTKKRRRSS